MSDESDALNELIDGLLKSVGGAARAMLDRVGFASEIRIVCTHTEAEMQIWVGGVPFATQKVTL